MRLKDKTVLITGAASGFGEGMALTFAAEGARVAVVDINAENARLVAGEIGSSAIAVTCDVSDGAQVAAAVHVAIESFGHLDIVVNNAGWSHKNQPILDVSYEDFKKVFEINVDSIFHMTHAVVPHWRQRGGGVMVNVGSTAGIRPRPGLTWYNATKGAVHNMTKSLALDFASDNIRINGIAPVLGATGLTQTFMGGPMTDELKEKFLTTIPLGRMSTPGDIANAALFLASDEAEFLTGVILEVDGGRTI